MFHSPSRRTGSRPSVDPVKPARRSRPTVEQLEDRSVPAALTYVNDNWNLVIDADSSTTVTAGDTVNNANDSGPLVGGVYGTDAFGTVTTTSVPGVTVPGSVAGSNTIQDAINATDPGGTVEIIAGTYSENVLVNKAVTLDGAGRGATIVAQSGIIFQVTSSDVTFRNMTIQNGSDGIRVVNAGGTVNGLTIDNVELLNHTARGIEINNLTTVTDFEIRNSLLDANRVGIRFASNAIGDGVSIDNTVFSNQTNPASGIGFYQANDGSTGYVRNLTVTNSTFENNAFAGVYGEELQNVLIQNSTFTGNGRGFYLFKAYDNAGIDAGDITIQGNVFADSTAATVLIWAGTFDGNHPTAALDLPVHILNNMISQDVGVLSTNWGVIDVRLLAGVTHAPVDIVGNTVTFAGTFSAPATAAQAIKLRGGLGDINISSNTLDGGSVGSTGGDPPTAGILLVTDDATWGPTSATATIDVANNFLRNFDHALSVYDQATNTYGHLPLGTSLTVFGNSITGNTAAIASGGGGTINASANWWGNTVASAIDDLVSGPVDFTPYLVSGSDTSAAAGFQGDFSTLYVTPLGAQTGTTGRIQEGFDLATTPGGTVNLTAGTYSENVAVPAGDTLAGNGTIDGAFTVSAGATVSPGTSPGIIHSDDLLLGANSSYAVELNGLTPGSGYDQLDVIGTVALGGMLNLSASFSPTAGSSFVIVANDGTDPIIGTFAGLPEGSVITAGGTQYALSYVGGDGNDVTLTALPPPPPPPPALVPLVAVGADAGGNGHVKVFNTDGSPRFSFLAFEGFNGSVRVATGDVNGDGIDDILVGAGLGALNGHVKLFDGASGALLASFFAFEGYAGAVDVAIGDVDNDGDGDLIVGSNSSSSHVKVFDVATGATLMSFLAHPGFNGGITVAAGDIDGVGGDEVITGVASNGPAHVMAFNAAGQTVASFIANASLAGINVGAGLLFGDNLAEIIVGPALGGGPVQAFAGNSAQLGVYDAGFGGANGLRVAASDLTGDGQDELLVAPGPGASAVVRAFDAASGALVDELAVFDGFLGGIFVG
jgi:hypothetical protein